MLAIFERVLQLLQLPAEAVPLGCGVRRLGLGPPQRRITLHQQPAEAVVLVAHGLKVVRQALAVVGGLRELLCVPGDALLALLQLLRRLSQLHTVGLVRKRPIHASAAMHAQPCMHKACGT